MNAVTELASTVGVFTACEVLGMARASFYRQRPRLAPSEEPPEPVAPGSGHFPLGLSVRRNAPTC